MYVCGWCSVRLSKTATFLGSRFFVGVFFVGVFFIGVFFCFFVGVLLVGDFLDTFRLGLGLEGDAFLFPIPRK